jgi:hypothetical protein
MIVTHTAEGWDVIFQSAHALLAYNFALELQGLRDRPFWSETLAAIVEHDDHKEAFGKNVYLTDLGAPRDFTLFNLTARERFVEVKRRIESGHRKHRWIGLLCSRHTAELYTKERTSRRMRSLLEAEEKRGKRVLEDLHASATDLEAAYQILLFCDRLSLILCQGQIPAMNRRVEVISEPSGGRYDLWETDDESLAIAPWPFERQAFEVAVEVRTLQQLEFASDRELQRHLRVTEVVQRRWVFRANRGDALRGICSSG